MRLEHEGGIGVGSCPECGGGLIVKADFLGTEFYVCPSCGYRTVVSTFEQICNWAGCLFLVGLALGLIALLQSC